MFITIECNYIFFVTIFLFISLFIENYVRNDAPSKERYNFSIFFFLILFANLVILLLTSHLPTNYELFDIFISDSKSHFVKQVLLIAQCIFFTFIFISYKSYLSPGVFYFFNVSLCSALFMSCTFDYIITFVLLELASMPVYALIALSKNRFAIEAAVKYLIFGSFASLLFITSYVFFCNIFSGANHVTDFTTSSLFFHPSTVDQLFSLFFFIAIFIKFGVGPFYVWLIDVYQASSYPVFVYNSTLAKLIMVIPIFNIGQHFSNHSYYKFFLISALLYSSFHASVNILFQNNIRRFFAYSSVANFSFLIISIFFSDWGYYFFFKCMIFYVLILLFSYSIFEVFRMRTPGNKEPRLLEDLSKVGDKYQCFYFALSLILASGLPPVGLFYAKALTYGLAMHEGFIITYILAALLVINSVISLFAYFRAISRTYNFANYQFAGRSDLIYSADAEEMLIFSFYMFIGICALSLNWNAFIAK